MRSFAPIVCTADVRGQEHVALKVWACVRLPRGFASLGIPDAERLRIEFPVYDAPYDRARLPPRGTPPNRRETASRPNTMRRDVDA